MEALVGHPQHTCVSEVAAMIPLADAIQLAQEKTFPELVTSHLMLMQS